MMPAMVNAHVHIAVRGLYQLGAKNYTPENVLDHLKR